MRQPVLLFDARYRLRLGARSSRVIKSIRLHRLSCTLNSGSLCIPQIALFPRLFDYGWTYGPMIRVYIYIASMYICLVKCRCLDSKSPSKLISAC